ncbi:Tetratricopeptide repeat-containing protein [Cladophialophora immunda]|nr:Tetratricopeptide repeat-containing protein [Cladophialophora immunda]
MDLSGPENPATLMTQSALAGSYRKMGQYEKAEKFYREVFAARQRSCGLDHFVTFDVALSLAYVYREMKRLDEALGYVNLVSSLDILRDQFERRCQMIHLRALLLYAEGQTDEGVSELQDLLSVAANHRPSSNREILWIRLSLADMLREQERPREALSLFRDLTHNTHIMALQGKSDLQSIIAEKALRLVRKGAIADNGLYWTRNEDFHILPGGPLTDTAWLGTVEDGPSLPTS